MCGITLLVTKQNDKSNDVLRRSLKKIRHRKEFLCVKKSNFFSKKFCFQKTKVDRTFQVDGRRKINVFSLVMNV